MLQSIILRHKEFWRKEYLLHLASALTLFGLSLVINYLSFSFATVRQSNYVSDLILDYLPVVDLGLIFIYGFLAIAVSFIILNIIYPSKILFSLKTLALFVLIRSFFVILTNIKVHPERIGIDSSILQLFSSEGDLFFSAHTGVPFLMALIFWREKIVRAAYLASSVVLGVIVLLTHVHYSIDVFSAYFISFSIYAISTRFFYKDYGLDPGFLRVFGKPV